MSKVMTEVESTRLENQVEGNELTQYLTFSVQEERFAVGITDVREIIEVDSLARVPMTPDYISGVINLRGSVVPVVDLAARLGRDTTEISDRSCIVMIELKIADQQQVLGMLVDTVNEILEIQVGDIQPPPSFGTDIRTEFIKQMGWVGDSFIILLDLDHLLAVMDFSMLDQISQTHQQSQSTVAKEQVD